MHPLQVYKDEQGTEQHEALQTCAFHAIACVGKHPPDQPQQILVPNCEALCNECHLDKLNVKPPPMDLHKIPGVSSLSSVTLLRGKAAQNNKEDVVDELTDESVCSWRPNAAEANTFLRAYKCANKVFRDPVTSKLYPNCPYHIKFCIRVHQQEATSGIEIANEYGLCTMHHMAEYQEAPVSLPQPYPGMVRKKFKRTLLFKTGHWAAPNWPQKNNIEVEKWEKIVYDDCIQMLIAFSYKPRRMM